LGEKVMGLEQWPNLNEMKQEVLNQFSFLISEYGLGAPECKDWGFRELVVAYDKRPLCVQIFYEVGAGIGVSVKFDGQEGSCGVLETGSQGTFERLGLHPQTPEIHKLARDPSRWKEYVQYQAETLRTLFKRDHVPFART
jgi:hypothetical protein